MDFLIELPIFASLRWKERLQGLESGPHKDPPQVRKDGAVARYRREHPDTPDDPLLVVLMPVAPGAIHAAG